MKVNRRRFLQGTAAAAATGAFGSSAWAEDPINVASIHDLSGGLDIYGKPMVDAITLAVEEANAIGQAHQLYCQLTGQHLTLRFDRERLWYEFLRAGFTLNDLVQVLRYLQ